MLSSTTPQCGRCTTTDRSRFDYPQDGLCSDCLYDMLDATAAANSEPLPEVGLNPDNDPTLEVTVKTSSSVQRICWSNLTPIQRSVLETYQRQALAECPADYVQHLISECGYRAMTRDCGPEHEGGVGWEVAAWMLHDPALITESPYGGHCGPHDDVISTYLVANLIVHIVL